MAPPAADDPETSSRSSLRLRLFAALVSLILLLGSFEILCQIYARTFVFPRLESRRDDPRHYWRASADPVLGYELRPDTEVMAGHRYLEINRYGIRDTSDDLAEGKRRIALLGDSVTFGVAETQPLTIPGLVQAELDPSGEDIKVLNLGVGGYELDQLLAHLRAKNAIYDLDDVVYLLNFNDFARRNSIYEGADNGMYRSYVRPTWMSLFFVRKAIYRLQKEEKMGSPGWYRWMFDGNEERGHRVLSAMDELGESEGFRFGVVLLPSGLSYGENGYELRDVHERLGRFLDEAGIPYVDPTDAFAGDVDRYYDGSDHFHEPGNRLMAEIVADFLREDFGVDD